MPSRPAASQSKRLETGDRDLWDIRDDSGAEANIFPIVAEKIQIIGRYRILLTSQLRLGPLVVTVARN
jgi:hypothetical protein